MATNWATAILTGVGAPANDANVAKMSAWNACEGNLSGKSGLGANNPFNTTLVYGGGTSINSDGVKQYPSLSVGIAATISTMLESRYSAVVSNLRNSGSDSQFASAVGSSGWGTSGSCIANVLGSGAPAVTGGSVSAAPATPSHISAQGGSGTGAGASGAAGGPTGTGTSTGNTPPAASSDTCAWSIGLVGCLLTKAQARAIIGGLVIFGAAIIGLIGADLLFKSAGLGGGGGLGKAAATTGELVALFPPAEGAGVALSAVGNRANRVAGNRARGRTAATGERRAATGERNAATSVRRAATGERNAKTAAGRARTYKYRSRTDREVGRSRAKTYRKDAKTRRYAAETGRQREERLATRRAAPRARTSAAPASSSSQFRSDAYR